ncbi:hypothetical protein IAU60_001171 [Kwoniella sp. DSM 27419]
MSNPTTAKEVSSVEVSNTRSLLHDCTNVSELYNQVRQSLKDLGIEYKGLIDPAWHMTTDNAKTFLEVMGTTSRGPTQSNEWTPVDWNCPTTYQLNAYRNNLYAIRMGYRSRTGSRGFEWAGKGSQEEWQRILAESIETAGGSLASSQTVKSIATIQAAASYVILLGLCRSAINKVDYKLRNDAVKDRAESEPWAWSDTKSKVYQDTRRSKEQLDTYVEKWGPDIDRSLLKAGQANPTDDPEYQTKKTEALRQALYFGQCDPNDLSIGQLLRISTNAPEVYSVDIKNGPKRARTLMRSLTDIAQKVTQHFANSRQKQDEAHAVKAWAEIESVATEVARCAERASSMLRDGQREYKDSRSMGSTAEASAPRPSLDTATETAYGYMVLQSSRDQIEFTKTATQAHCNEDQIRAGLPLPLNGEFPAAPGSNAYDEQIAELTRQSGDLLKQLRGTKYDDPDFDSIASFVALMTPDERQASQIEEFDL